MDKDLLVIGGGINGVGIAADAAGRGLKVILCEMGDLASATSSASSRLIHGGLRYLENYEFKLVRESLQERSILLHNAPHLVKLQEFVMPYCPWLRPYWMLRAGLFLYDHLAYNPIIPGSKSVAANTVSALQLRPEFTRALSYYDCTEDDSRLVVSVALLAKQHGAQIQTRTKVVKAVQKDDGWLVTIAKGQDISVIKVKAIVNAAGPWVQKVATDILHVPTQHKIKLVKGSHIIVPRLFDHNKAFILQNKDNRVVFLIPYLEHFTLIGTTEIVLQEIEQPVNVSDEEITYLCDITNQFVQRPIHSKDVISKYAGMRPLQDDGESATKVTRDYTIETLDQPTPIISIFGGKITTYRHLAEDVGNKLSKYFPNCGKAWTKNAYLPGGYFLNNDVNDFIDYVIKSYKFLPENLLIHYVNNYGTRIGDVLEDIQSSDELGQHFGALLYQREVDFLVENEWAQTAEDILWRRGKMGLWFTAEQTQNLENYLKK